MKDIKDYIHLYINGEAKYRLQFADYEDGRWTVWANLTEKRYRDLNDRAIIRIEYALRRLEDITPEEKAHAYDYFDSGPGLDFDNESFTWWLHSDGFHYLLKQGFDLFGLVDAGLAIDFKTLNQQV